MLKKMPVATAVLLIFGGFFCTASAQSREAVITLDSAEQIEAFQKILGDGGAQSREDESIGTALSGPVNTENGLGPAVPAEADFKVYKPQAKEVFEYGDTETGAGIPAGKNVSEGLSDFVKKDNSETESNIKRLDSPEDMAEFKELIKNAQIE